ncbi:MAG: CrcB family protein [Brevibacterium sp.]|uniref:fluoride efflux transporter FluC n=1 Tax=Brevibacterium TaxID=1696 RepID=UPI0026481E99|nr:MULTISPECIES: CrcB family protein [Brevibacterium]MDN5586902.1 CrcB family protein [Brevibacterium sp.]MDN5658952.1 CrcB family protein [Brevibacterium sandarakinum]MDN5806795.1 CrcB family protein [Brevibacterium sp.]MDN5909236.1 CrcB family protein [Brevibacterium sp.]MDN6134470.1 CrcB family protein [Brevibacterium sp.]
MSSTLSTRPVHLRLPYLCLVVVGGTIGTAAREGLTLAFPSAGGIPYATFTINVVGAFLLGLLLDALVRMGPDDGLRRRIRVMVGTGFMGGFTTYSALAVSTAGLLGEGQIGFSIAYGLGTILIGGAATGAGIVTATVLHGRSHARSARQSPDATLNGGAR